MNEYEKDEIKYLEYYAERKSHKYLDYEVINKFLKFLCNPEDVKYLTNSWFYIDPNKIKLIFEAIEKLYCLCCKYGNKHNIPEIIYRQQHHYDNILKHVDKFTNLWLAESFLSFTKDGNNVDRFKFHENCALIKGHVNPNVATENVPFIDVTDVLGEDPDMEDEKEILLPPFTLLKINPNNCYDVDILSKNDININDYSEKLYNELLEKFVQFYEAGQNEEFNKVRKQLKHSFSKKLLIKKSNIMF